MEGVVRAGGERRRRGASPGHAALSGSGGDEGRKRNRSADREVPFLLGAAGPGMRGLLRQKPPAVTPAGSAALSPARPDARRAGDRTGMLSSLVPRLIPGRTRGWAWLRFKQMGPAALLAQRWGRDRPPATHPESRSLGPGWAPSSSRHLPHSTPYYPLTPNILLTVEQRCSSIVRTNLPLIRD